MKKILFSLALSAICWGTATAQEALWSGSQVTSPVINADGTVYSCANDSIVLETAGKITIGANYYTTGTTYTVTRKALAITENGVTTTYYVADIT